MSYPRYNRDLKRFARQNRKSMPKSAISLWKYVLSKRQLLGYSFKRERPIDRYIVDFFCSQLNLIIEVDGITHLEEGQARRDAQRDARLNSLGYKVLRIDALDVLSNINEVVEDLESWITENTNSSSVHPLCEGEERSEGGGRKKY